MKEFNLKSKEVIPYDDFLEINELSFKMSKETMLEVAFWGQNQSSFLQAKNMLEKYRGINLGSDTILKVTEHVGKIVFEEDKKQADSNYENIANLVEEKPKTKGVLYGEIDGAAVNTRVEDENGSTWKENKLGIFFDDNDLRKRNDKSNIIENKEYVTYFGNVNEFQKHLFNCALKHDYLSYSTIIFITDGATWIRNMLNELFPEAIQILDLYHLKENIYEYAKAVFKGNDRKIKNFVDRTIERIYNKEFNLIYRELKKYEDIKLPVGIVNLKTYISNNENKMDYRTYEKNGWFVGSGAIESANKTIVQKRLKQAGMRWSILGAQYLLTLRAKFESNLWDFEVRKRVYAY